MSYALMSSLSEPVLVTAWLLLILLVLSMLLDAREDGAGEGSSSCMLKITNASDNTLFKAWTQISSGPKESSCSKVTIISNFIRPKSHGIVLMEFNYLSLCAFARPPYVAQIPAI